MNQITFPAGYVRVLSKNLENSLWIMFRGHPPIKIIPGGEELPFSSTIFFPFSDQAGVTTELSIMSGEEEDKEGLQIINRIPLSIPQSEVDDEKGFPLFFTCDEQGMLNLTLSIQPADGCHIPEDLDGIIRKLLGDGLDIFQITAELSEMGINRDMAMNLVLLVREESRSRQKPKIRASGIAFTNTGTSVFISLAVSAFFSLCAASAWIALALHSGQRLEFMSCAVGLAAGLGFSMFANYSFSENPVYGWLLYVPSAFALFATLFASMLLHTGITWHEMLTSIPGPGQESQHIEKAHLFTLPSSAIDWIWIAISSVIARLLSSPPEDNENEKKEEAS